MTQRNASRWGIDRESARGATAVLLAVLVVASGLAVAVPAVAADGGQFTTKEDHGLTYKVYVPSSYESGDDVPVFVMLHGCLQSPDSFARDTEMNALAEERNFIVVYPKQPITSNMMKCWNWFSDGDTERGSGEAEDIARVTEEVVQDYSVNEEKVYIAGMSAGGAMAPNVAYEYSDVFTGVGIHSGLQYDAASNAFAGITAMKTGGGDPQDLGEAAYDTMREHGNVAEMPTIVMHGREDGSVDIVAGKKATEQAVVTNDLANDGQDDDDVSMSAADVERGSTGAHDYTVKRFADDTGSTKVVALYVAGMDHAWSGGTGGKYTDEDAPEARRMMYQFLTSHSGNGDPAGELLPEEDDGGWGWDWGW